MRLLLDTHALLWGPMKVVIQIPQKEELKALPILLRHSPGVMLRNGTYVLNADAVRRLHEEGVRFAEVAREGEIPLCQDTGLVVVFLELGQDVHVVGPQVLEAPIQEFGGGTRFASMALGSEQAFVPPRLHDRPDLPL